MKKRLLALTLLGLMLLTLFSGCGDSAGEKTTIEGGKLSFKAASDYDTLKSLAGTSVTISGYMATSSPVDGSYIFLMNLPYQSCPFCVPNTSQLSNTIEVYPEKNKTFDYTTQAITVVGTLEVAPEDEPFTDDYGYEFSFKLVDASYQIMDTSQMGEKMTLYNKLAEADVISDIYSMYDYVNFLCDWPEYYVDSYEDTDGNTQPGYYLWPSDVWNFLETEGSQWNYGYQDGYFQGIIDEIEKIDPEAFSTLTQNIADAEVLAQEALAELEAENYTSENTYVEMFDNTDDVYTLTNGEKLLEEWQTLYYAFSDWLAEYEM